MDEREVAKLFAEEMSQLLTVMRGQIGAPALVDEIPSPDSRAEFVRAASALFDLCATFELDDCAEISRALAEIRATLPTQSQVTRRAVISEACVYLERRLDDIQATGALAPASAVDGTKARALAAALRGSQQATGPLHHSLVERRELTSAPSVAELAAWESIADSDTLSSVPGEEPLSEAELALVARFQETTLRTGSNGGVRDADETQAVRATGEDRSSEQAPTAATSTEPHTSSDMSTAGTAAQYAQTPTAEDLDTIPPELKRLFLVETAEDLQEMRVALLKLGESPHDVSALHAMRRIAHKIRGSAGTLQYPLCEKIVLVYEDLLKLVAQANVYAAPFAHSILLRGLVILQIGLSTAEATGDADAGLLQQANGLAQEMHVSLEEHTHPVAGDHVHIASPVEAASGAEAPTTVSGVLESETSLRVDLRRLDTLISHATELTINRAGISHHIEDIGRLQVEMDQSIARLHRLSAQLTDAPTLGVSQRGAAGIPDPRSGQLSSAWDVLRRASRGGSGPGHPGPGHRVRWDELELDRLTETDDALRALAEAISDMAANTSALRLALAQLGRLTQSQAELATEIHRDVMHVRLVPLSELVPRLRLEVKRVAPLVHKDVVFRVNGEMTHIDRNISEALADPLTQLVRNAVTHGIETPDERAERGKPLTGEVWMNAYYVGSEVVIEIGDDGGGANPNQIAYRAVFKGLLDEDAVRNMSPQEKLDLMFLPGLTGLDQADAVGGQGIGLFGVKDRIEELRGSIQARSELGGGTVFRVRVPISLSVVQAVHVLVGQETFAVPMSSVQRVMKLHPLEILTDTEHGSSASRPGLVHATRHLRLDSTAEAPTSEQSYEDVPLLALADLLGLAPDPRERQKAIIVELGRRRVGVLVDGDAGQSEVVVQALPSHLRRRAVRGATVMPDGQVRLVLDLPELIAEADQGTRTAQSPRMRPTPRLTRALAPRVLVVDDSVSIRRTLELALTRAHFEVQLARDGVEALEMMLVSPPRVVVLDIEMPRLDGFELLTMMRETPQFEQVRVVMLTSRASDKHRRHAHALGASAYLVKPCPQEILIDTVRGLLDERPPQ